MLAFCQLFDKDSLATALEDLLFVANDSSEVLLPPKQLSPDMKKLADTLVAHRKLYFTSNERSNYDDKGYQMFNYSPVNEITKTKTSTLNVDDHIKGKSDLNKCSLENVENDYKNKMEIDESGGECDGLLIDRGDCYETAASSDYSSQSLPISVVSKEYPGFSSLGPDLYISIADPCLQVKHLSSLPAFCSRATPSIFISSDNYACDL